MSKPTKEQIEKARVALQASFGTTFASASESGRGWPEDAYLLPIAHALAAETAPLHEKIARLEQQLAAQTGEVNEHGDLCFQLRREPMSANPCRMLICPNCDLTSFEVALADNGQWNIECANCGDTADVLTEVLAKLR